MCSSFVRGKLVTTCGGGGGDLDLKVCDFLSVGADFSLIFFFFNLEISFCFVFICKQITRQACVQIKQL